MRNDAATQSSFCASNLLSLAVHILKCLLMGRSRSRGEGQVAVLPRLLKCSQFVASATLQTETLLPPAFVMEVLNLFTLPVFRSGFNTREGSDAHCKFRESFLFFCRMNN
jgi:hypothetical protein